MKTVIIILVILLASIATGFYTYQSPITTEMSVLRDITDMHLAQPGTNEVSKLFDLSGENMWNGVLFRFSNVSDVSYNQTSETKIEAVNKWLSNEIERSKQIKQFQNELSQIITDGAGDRTGKDYSSVYLPLARELKKLSESKGQKKIFLVFSDLMQNDFDVSLYDKKEFELIQSNPDSLKQLFEKQEPMPVLTGIQIYLVYQPENAEKDKRYRIVSEFYKNLFEEKGATVHIQANL